MEELLHAVIEVYGHAVRSSEQYTIEIDAGEASEFRKHLQALQQQIEAAAIPEDWKTIQACFRGELRDYRDKAAGHLGRLREEIKAAGEAVQLFAESVASSDSDHKVQIKEALGRLDVISQVVNPEELRRSIRQVSSSISESIEVMRRSHQVAIAQLRDEIRLLHKQVDIERNAHLVDRATGVWNREKLDSRVAKLVADDQPFCILLVYIRNLKRLDTRYSRTVIEGTFKALLQRFSAMLDDSAVIGRWDDNSFAAILRIPAASAISLSRTATAKLSGEYSVQENGLSHNVPLVAVAGVIDQAAGGDAASFRLKLEQMSGALAGA